MDSSHLTYCKNICCNKFTYIDNTTGYCKNCTNNHTKIHYKLNKNYFFYPDIKIKY